jgi:hypothetical protein
LLTHICVATSLYVYISILSAMGCNQWWVFVFIKIFFAPNNYEICPITTKHLPTLRKSVCTCKCIFQLHVHYMLDWNMFHFKIENLRKCKELNILMKLYFLLCISYFKYMYMNKCTSMINFFEIWNCYIYWESQYIDYDIWNFKIIIINTIDRYTYERAWHFGHQWRRLNKAQFRYCNGTIH